MKGYKTYSVAILVGIGAVLVNLGVLSAEDWARVEPALLALGLWFARVATGRLE